MGSISEVQGARYTVNKQARQEVARTNDVCLSVIAEFGTGIRTDKQSLSVPPNQNE